jgi:hypothetical protein
LRILVHAKALEIARALPVPKGNCDRDGVNPVVDSIDSASITARDNTAVAAIAGRVTAWACAKVLGIKTETVSDSVALTAPVEILVVDQKQLGLKLAGSVGVKTGNGLTAEVANLLANALNANEARASAPNVPGLEVNIQNAQFAADGNVLLVRANGTARMSSESFSTFLGLLTK